MPIIICPNCSKEKKHYGKGLCQGCYNKFYFRKYHADYERQRRKEQKEHVNALDRARNKKPARVAWRQEYQQTYYAENKTALLDYQRNYRVSDPERQARYARTRNTRKNSLPNTLTEEQWHKLLKKYENSCFYCKTGGVKLEEDHKTPVSHGGGRTIRNIVPCCVRCNRRKKDKTAEEFMEYRKKYP